MRGLWDDPTFHELIQGGTASAAPANVSAPTTADSEAQERPAPGGPSAEKKIKLTLTQDDLAKIPHREPAKNVSRAEVQQALKAFLEDLAKAQKNNRDLDVKSTDKVWQADVTLHEGLQEATVPYTPTGGDGHLYQPADLAAKIAACLPDEIPGANFEKLQKMKPKETELSPDTITGQLHKKYAETRDAIASKLPKRIQKYAKSAMDMVIQKGAAYVLEKGLDELDIPSDLKDGVKKVVEDFVKKSTEGKSESDE